MVSRSLSLTPFFKTHCSQWQTELEKFAPHLSILVVHNAENPSIQVLASADVVIASTFLLQQTSNSHKKSTASFLLRMLKKIHWHRICVDEGHYNQQGHRIKESLSMMSATYRWNVTGTPIGASLSDLLGQLQFLRISPFNRIDFWKNNIENPFHERNTESLMCLRSLLSHVIVRHSKEQTLATGRALLDLPPRTVETVLLKFGCEDERSLYDDLENRNRNHFRKLMQESVETVASKHFELTGMLSATRQAAAHGSLLDLIKLNRFNLATEAKRRAASNSSSSDDGHGNTRASILTAAVDNARLSAKTRMRLAVNGLQSGEMIECPVCFDACDETDVCLPACAHPICSACIMSVLSAASQSREAKGNCPTCRDVMLRSELIFLGDATDAGKTETMIVDLPHETVESAVTAIATPCYQLTAADAHVSVTGASTLRVGRTVLAAVELQECLLEDRSLLPTLNQDFLTYYYRCERKVGTKIARLLQEINLMMSKDSKSKAVVFSQFLGVLDIAAEELRARGIKFVRIDGNCKQHERADALLSFSDEPDCKVFLLSMRAGAVGLTLTSADTCFILDVCQNSAIEEQAIDRIHRM